MTLPLTLATTSFLPCDKRTMWPPWTKRPITHQHRATATKVSSRLTDKDSQPPIFQVGLGQRVYILPGAWWVTLGHLPPVPQHPRTPGHKAFRSQLTANELGGLRFADVVPKWSTMQPRSARANPLWQPRALGIWGRYLPTKIPHLSGTPDACGSDLQLMPPQGHHTRRPPTTIPEFSSRDQFNAAAASCNNEHLQVVLSPQQHPNVHFWQMLKIWEAREWVHAQDGIHLNRRGQGCFYHNIWQAAIAGAKLLL